MRSFERMPAVLLSLPVAASLVALALLTVSCREGGAAQPDPSKPSAPTPTAQATAPVELGPDGVPLPTQAQAKLQAIKLWLGAQELNAELALTAPQVRAGMMFRTNLADSEAMLFVFGVPHRASFWMKNVPIDMSCAYIGPDSRILEVRDMERMNTNQIVASTDRVQFVLEVARGWFERYHVGPGAEVRTERGTLAETFFRRR